MASRLPSTFRKLVVTQLTTNFRDAVKMVSVPMSEASLGPKDVLVKNRYVGINASDINVTSGRYDRTAKPPFDSGMEGVGEVVATGPQVSRVKIGQPVGYVKFGAFSEFTIIGEEHALPLAEMKAEYVPFFVSGLTASLALDKVGEIKPGEKVLITAAAGGTGQFAVQIAKSIGCHVIGTCSTDEKVQFLKSIGCDRPINYKTENLKEVLKAEYPNGVDVVYETIGGDIFDTCIHALAQHGRLIVIGFISGYENKFGFSPLRTPAIPALLLNRSASLRGFIMFHFAQYYEEHLAKLVEMHKAGKLKSFVDMGPGNSFRGMDSIVEAVEHLYSQKSVGKVVVELPSAGASQL